VGGWSVWTINTAMRRRISVTLSPIITSSLVSVFLMRQGFWPWPLNILLHRLAHSEVGDALTLTQVPIREFMAEHLVFRRRGNPEWPMLILLDLHSLG
jgi:hypothetical protein